MGLAKTRSQCGGQGFDPPLLHHLTSYLSITYRQQTNETWKSFGVILTSLRRIVFENRVPYLGQHEKSPMKTMVVVANPSELTPDRRAGYAETTKGESL